ncbi:DUF2461 domain-containing protein [Sediminibacterium goheungense]|uniref:Uncharacterized protein (TIGR02453 family) n=1 Tax=Sediminibacterium goheungense TaxID=1086393 RepID=A0A4R6IVG6_9BACT|nr:DUF2461 domain-containing protein [Sediminibacterium goheungense]TDO26612.1 uncharacterized protein (TIGR02453 family) [Sediminibacterium goheungense]
MLQNSTLKFLRDLKKNNHKTWFDSNRKAFEAAKADYATLVNEVIKGLGKKDPFIAPLTAKECVFRINRDVRFSKNKDPYKTNMGMYLSRDGKKSLFSGYYFHLEPGGKSFAAGGLWMPEADVIKKVRQEIDYNWNEFSKIIQNKKFVSVYTTLQREEGMVLSREPKGYEKDNPAIEYIKLKSWVATTTFTDAQLTSNTLAKDIVAAFETLQPLILFLNRAIEE